MDIGFALDTGENVARIVHRSWASLVPSWLLAFVLTLAAATLAYMSARYPGAVPFPGYVTLALIIVCAMLGAIIFAIGAYLYDHNLLVITNMRLFEIEVLSLFNRRESQLDLRRIQDTTGQTMGIFGTLFNYGDLQVQSAGEDVQFIFHYAPHPEVLANDLITARDECIQRMGPAAPLPAAQTL